VKKKHYLAHKTMVETTKKENKLLVESLQKNHGRTIVTQESKTTPKYYGVWVQARYFDRTCYLDFYLQSIIKIIFKTSNISN
jgi:hypothetical protein